MTETELIRKAKQGNDAAIEALYESHASRVYSIVRRLTGDDALAEDCAQETWIRVIHALPKFRSEARFSTWVHRIAVNCALQGRRSRLRLSQREEPLPPALPGRSKQPDALLNRRLEQALDELPLGMREVLVLHDVEGYTHEEIGKMLGVASGTSKSQLWKARSKMRIALQPVVHVSEGEAICST